MLLQWVSVDIAPMSRSVTPSAGRASKPNQFAPQGINPAELKEKVKAVCVCRSNCLMFVKCYLPLTGVSK